MIRDYSEYEMSEKEKLVFYAAGYCLIAILVYLFYHSIILSILLGGAVLWLKPFYCEYMVSKRMQQLNVQFKDMLTSLSASVSAGRQMSEAIIEASENLSLQYDETKPIMMELRHMKMSIIENNESDAVLLRDFAERTRNEDINNFVQVYLTCRSLGGNLENIILRTSGILADKMAIQREIQALTAQKKLEGRMIAFMPPAMLFMLNLASPSYIEPLYETIVGRIIMTFSLAAILWGTWLTEKISTVNL